MSFDSAGYEVVRSQVECLECQRGHLEFRFRSPPTSETVERCQLAMRRELETRAVWTTGVAEERLADPCLKRAAEGIGVPLSTITLIVAQALHDSKEARGACVHGILVNGHLCTALTHRPRPDDDRVGLIPIPSFLTGEISSETRRRANLPVDREFLEAAKDEPTFSLQEMDALEDWRARQHGESRERRPWTHLILVSHAWGHPEKPRTSWADVKARVNSWVNRELAKPHGQRNPRVKATKREDFGVWVDYMMVPNGQHAKDAPPCELCRDEKKRTIQRINALLSLATVIPMNDKARHRGWILQELTLDAHGETKYEHRDRVSLMARHVDFTTDHGEHATDDGLMLRCNEFVRLSQTPRVWPSVNLALLERLRAAGYTDEASDDAWNILTDYARRFDMNCHRLKRLMADLSQKLAVSRRDGHGSALNLGRGSFEQPFDLSELEKAIREQSDAMAALATAIAADDRPDLARAVQDVEQAANALQARLPPGLAPRLSASWAAYRQELGKLQSGATDPEWGLSAISIDERRHLTDALQWQQFVGVVTGLRSEWLYSAGLAAWVRLSAITEALTATKFMARLKDGQVRFSPARSLTLEAKPRPLHEQVALAKRVSSEGVRVADAVMLYELGRKGRAELKVLGSKASAS